MPQDELDEMLADIPYTRWNAGDERLVPILEALAKACRDYRRMYYEVTEVPRHYANGIDADLLRAIKGTP